MTVPDVEDGADVVWDSWPVAGAGVTVAVPA